MIKTEEILPMLEPPRKVVLPYPKVNTLTVNLPINRLTSLVTKRRNVSSWVAPPSDLTNFIH